MAPSSWAQPRPPDGSVSPVARRGPGGRGVGRVSEPPVYEGSIDLPGVARKRLEPLCQWAGRPGRTGQMTRDREVVGSSAMVSLPRIPSMDGTRPEASRDAPRASSGGRRGSGSPVTHVRGIVTPPMAATRGERPECGAAGHHASAPGRPGRAGRIQRDRESGTGAQVVGAQRVPDTAAQDQARTRSDHTSLRARLNSSYRTCGAAASGW